MPASILIATILAASALTVADAEACACCDATENRAPIGWTDEGGAVLVEVSTTAACEYMNWLEVWVIGAGAPSACYDLLADPNKRIVCSAVDYNENKRPRRSGSTARFSHKEPALPAGDVRVQRRLLSDSGTKNMRLGVDLKIRGEWKRAWNGVIDAQDRNEPASATVWPNERGDRAVLIMKYVHGGTGNAHTEMHWLTVPR